jgi:hypothetical protein
LGSKDCDKSVKECIVILFLFGLSSDSLFRKFDWIVVWKFVAGCKSHYGLLGNVEIDGWNVKVSEYNQKEIETQNGPHGKKPSRKIMGFQKPHLRK